MRILLTSKILSDIVDLGYDELVDCITIPQNHKQAKKKTKKKTDIIPPSINQARLEHFKRGLSRQ